LYPNPVHDVLNFQLAQAYSKEATVELLSIDGKVIVSQLLGFNFSVCQVSVSALKPDIYLCRFNNGTVAKTTKFFKQ
jgi:Secretion system C-terminal sorting domain